MSKWIRDSQETVATLGTDGHMHRTALPLANARDVTSDVFPVTYAASLEDLAETLALLCEKNHTAPLPIRKAAILAELERHAEMPKRP